MKLNIVDFAHQVIEMQDRIIDLQIENSRLRQYESDYHELLQSSLHHNENMMMNMLDVCLTPGVLDAMSKRSLENETN
jgi:hypothetical protein